MGLWNALHTLFRVKPAGPRPAGKKGARRGARPRSRLEVEVLDQRLLPSSFQWGVGRAVDALQPPAPTESVSLNFATVATGQVPINSSPPLASFSWGAVNS
jgi:hypothetical protein